MTLIGMMATGNAAAEEPPQGSVAQVCVRRAAGASGWAVPLTVRLDGIDVENFAVGEQRCFEVAPGWHQFGALYWGRMDRTTTRPAATKEIELLAGECHYYKVIMGFWGVLLRDTDDRRFREPARCSAR